MGSARQLVLLVLAGAATVAASRSASSHANSFRLGTRFDLRVYLTESKARYDAFDDADLVWHEAGLEYCEACGDREKEVSHTASRKLLTHKRARAVAHVFVTKQGYFPGSKKHAKDRGLKYSKLATSYKRVSLVRKGDRRKSEGLRNLLTDERAPWEVVLDAVPEEERKSQIRYWVPMLHISLVFDPSTYPLNGAPGLLAHYLLGHAIDPGAEWIQDAFLDRSSGDFSPIIFVNELAITASQMVPLNASLGSPTSTSPSPDDANAHGNATLPLQLHYSPLSLFRFEWFLQLRQSFKQQEELLGISPQESEDLRGMFVHTNPVLLWTTVAVSCLHLVFDVLAFKNDVSFWRSVESMDGLSTRAVVMSFFMELVILLYLSEQGASWLVQVTSALSLVVGVFKIFKSLSIVRSDRARKAQARGAAANSGAETETETETETDTERFDRQAFAVLLPPIAVLVVGYTAYTLVYEYHRGWLSWALGSLAMLVYGMGFIVMTPQLFINYKLKSVAHLPWRFFMYKALNTFIDDLFAFIIKMPTMHRMSCFRDDIVFVVFLYQRWIYRVDTSRRNEFGTTGDEEESKSKKTNKSADAKKED